MLILPRIPPYFALIIRAISVLEGVALVANPDFAIVDEVLLLIPAHPFFFATLFLLSMSAGSDAVFIGCTGVPICRQEAAHRPKPTAAGCSPVYGASLFCPDKMLLMLLCCSVSATERFRSPCKLLLA